MRRLLLYLAIAIGSVGCAAEARNLPLEERTTDDEAFAELAPYGTWSEDDTFGTVWTPADEDFVPYGNDGRFADLGSDLVWISDVPWGATTLHRGRWVHRKNRWRWVPGKAYAGAWVKLTHDGGHTAWSPAPPTHVWRHGRRVKIAAIAQPIVGSRDDDELALVPPNPPPKELVHEAPRAQAADVASHARRESADAAEAFADWSDDVVFAAPSGGRGSGHGGAPSHGGHVSVNVPSARAGGSSHGGSVAAAAGHR